jgi:GDP-4-dehydro-6-deoxy-D-mannose reductase
MATWLITGATGFVGGHVLQAIAADPGSQSREVVVLGRRRPDGFLDHSFIAADLEDSRAVDRAVRSIEPDYVIHTAGRTPPATDDALYRANLWGTVHLLAALRSLERPVRIVISGSAAELGPVDERHLPVSEHYIARPETAYGWSKWFATRAGQTARPPLEVMLARVFNPIGPGTPNSQAFGRFATLLSEPGHCPITLSVGELDTRRDFIDVRDVARSLIALAIHGQPGLVYHVGTGQSHSVRDGLDALIAMSGRTVRVESHPALVGRGGPADSRADITRIASHTGWRPETSWQDSLRDLWAGATAQRKLTSIGVFLPVF